MEQMRMTGGGNVAIGRESGISALKSISDKKTKNT
jgi:hypothetical protein